MATCDRCGEKVSFFAPVTMDQKTGQHICNKCWGKERDGAPPILSPELQKQENAKKAARSVIVTTTQSIDGYYIKKYIGIESVEYVIGTGLFSEVSSDIADFFGSRSSAFEKKLQAAKQTAMFGLKYRAAFQGANAVVGVDLDYTEFSGNRVALIINGTLVEIAPRVAKPAPS